MIIVNDLVAGYGGPPVLKGVSFDVADGDFVGILGPNACGKSTLVKCLTGLLSPVSGEIRLAGKPLESLSARQRAQTVAVVPQSTEIPFPFPGREVVEMGRFARVGRFAALSTADHAAVARALEATDTLPLADRPVTELSGGERQRLVLARALAQEAPLLLLDEATAAMDAHRKIDAFDLLAAQNRAGTTILAVMHDLNLAALYCRRLIFLRDGRIAADGPTAEVFRRDLLENLYDTPLDVLVHEGTPQALYRAGRKESRRA